MTGHGASASELVRLVLLRRWDHLPPSYNREPDLSLKIIISVPVIFFKNCFYGAIYFFSTLVCSSPLLFVSYQPLWGVLLFSVLLLRDIIFNF